MGGGGWRLENAVMVSRRRQLEGIVKVVAVAQSTYYPGFYLEVLRKNTKPLG